MLVRGTPPLQAMQHELHPSTSKVSYFVVRLHENLSNTNRWEPSGQHKHNNILYQNPVLLYAILSQSQILVILLSNVIVCVAKTFEATKILSTMHKSVHVCIFVIPLNLYTYTKIEQNLYTLNWTYLCLSPSKIWLFLFRHLPWGLNKLGLHYIISTNYVIEDCLGRSLTTSLVKIQVSPLDVHPFCGAVLAFGVSPFPVEGNNSEIIFARIIYF